MFHLCFTNVSADSGKSGETPDNPERQREEGVSILQAVGTYGSCNAVQIRAYHRIA